MHHKSMFFYLLSDQVGHDTDDSCAPNDDRKYNNKVKHNEDVKTISDMNIDTEKLEDINDIGGDDLLLNDDIINEENQGNHFGAHQHKNQQNIFSDN